MNLRQKFALVISVLYLLVLGSVLVWFAVLFRTTGTELAAEPEAEIKELEFGRIQSIAEGEAKRINDFLDDYYRDVEILQAAYGFYDKNTMTDWLDSQSVYASSMPGLPQYGFVNEKYGVYADFDKRGSSCPWMPKKNVTKALTDVQFRKQVAGELDVSVSLNPIFKFFYEKHKETLDLIWVVFSSGVTNVVPAYDYNEIIKEDPTIVDLDESQEDYVRLLNPENNPERHIRWLDPYYDSFRRTWMTSVVAPLYKNNKFQGTIGMDILLDNLTVDVVNISLANKSFSFLLDSKGGVLAMPQNGIEAIIKTGAVKFAFQELFKPLEEQEWDEETLALLAAPLIDGARDEWKDLLSDMLAQKSGTRIINVDGEDMVASSVQISNAGWSLAVVVPAEDVFFTSHNISSFSALFLQKLGRNFFIVILISCLFLLGVLLYIYLSNIKPIIQLTDIVRDWRARGIVNTMSPTSQRQDEIGILVREFALSQENLKKEICAKEAAQKELSDLVDNLEYRVQERTAEVELANEKLRTLDELKDEFLDTTTHELKTPLIPIKTQSQLLLDGDYGELNEEQRKSIKMIYRNEERLNQLASDILDITKIQSRKLKLIPEKVNLEKIFKNTVEDMSALAREKGQTLTAKLDKLPDVVVDVRKIVQVVGNLLNNAIKFTPVGGQIQLEAGVKDFAIIVRIRDNGIGIDKKYFSKLFVPFSQIDIGLTKKYEGTGLGLAICKGIVEAHGGKIWAESAGLGQGSVFSFSLPLANGLDER
jgi:signal transduction histidine kinase